MKWSNVHRIPHWANEQVITRPATCFAPSGCTVIGFDTEYDSKTGELLTVQLFGDGISVYHKVAPGAVMDYPMLRSLIADVERPFLVAFFALADISKIADTFDAHLYETGLGMIYAEWRDMTIFDVSVFWSGTRGFSLKNLGELIGLPKLNWTRDRISRRDVNKPGFQAYAMRDAEICFHAYNWLRESVQRLFNEDICNYRSAPSLSARIWRQRLKEPINYPSKRVRKMALRCYWGGRAEIFQVGAFKGPFIEIDANSEYPRSAISLRALPDGDQWQYGGAWDSYTNGFVRVDFTYPDDHDGFFGLPVETEQGLIWPKSGESWCTIGELRASVFYCPELQFKVTRVCGYHIGTRLEVADYLAELLREKDKSKGADRTVYKLLANSFIGKLGQNKRTVARGEYLTRCRDHGVPAGWLPRRSCDVRVVTGSVFWPEAAALILGKAREVLFRAMESIGREKVMLVSTDSIIFHGSQFDTLRIDGVPFEEQARGNALRIFREKVYILSDNEKAVKTAHHALPFGAISVRTSTQKGRIYVSSKEFVKLSGAMRGETLGDVRKKRRRITLKPKRKQ